MNIREQRQLEAKSAYLLSDRRSIVNACPRFGKIKVAIDIMRELGIEEPMILAPRLDIEKGWKDDFEKFGYKGRYEFRTFSSIKKFIFFSHRFVIIDEAHEMSVNQQKLLAPHIKDRMVLGLTGTITQKTRTELYNHLDLDVCYKYSIDEGVDEGILADYEIYIHEIDLQPTERRKFRSLKYIRDKPDTENKHFFDMKLINIIQNSKAKLQKTRELLRGDSRVLVFCGVTDIADELGIPVYHSKAKEKAIFDSFCGGEGNYLATIKMMQAGVTINPIDRGVINYMSGNPEDGAQKICRFLGYEYLNPEKKAIIHIVSSTEPFERERLKTGLQFFNNKKIHYVLNNKS